VSLINSGKSMIFYQRLSLQLNWNTKKCVTADQIISGMVYYVLLCKHYDQMILRYKNKYL